MVSGPAADTAGTGLAGAMAVSGAPAQFGLSPELAQTVRSASQQAFVDGLSVAAVVGAVIVAFAAIAVFILLPSDRKDFGGPADAAEGPTGRADDLDAELDQLVGATFDADVAIGADDGPARTGSGPDRAPSSI